jgi:diaminopimelate decarboxylase
MPPRSLLRKDIAGVAVHTLARDFGTPLYVYDAARIRARIRDLRAFDVIRYAQKAASNLALLDLVRREGACIDAVSAGEVHRALAAGFSPGGDPPGIVYTADIFDRDALDLVVEREVHVNCGSVDMIDQYAERLGAAAAGRGITLRINPGFGHGSSRKTNTGGEHSKHGIWFEDLASAVRQAGRHGLVVRGLHVHIGSGTDLEHLSRVCGAVERFAREVGPSVATLSAGGGLPVPYRSTDSPIDLGAYFARWDAARKRLEDAFGHRIALEIEPGRYVVAEAGFLVTEIRAVKRTAAHAFYLVDAGFNDLARPVMYGAYHPISLATEAADAASRSTGEVVVGGPLCESGDIFTQHEGGIVYGTELPEARVGEYLVIEVAGAYGAVMSSNYNSKLFAAEVLVSDGKAHLVRARQSYQDLIRLESIPSTS